MGQLKWLELENFKSYYGHQVIGPFSSFTSIIGPNGSGKSNLMDAISFVLGIRSTQLRSTKLTDLIYHSGTSGDPDNDQEGATARPKTAWVEAVYEDNGGIVIRFRRTITRAGGSEFRIDGKLVTAQIYNKKLQDQDILINARNFLVFQGDVETIASQSPRDLTRMVEQISGSWELRARYDELKANQDTLAEQLSFAFNKKKTVTAEIRAITEEKNQLELYEKKRAQLQKLTAEFELWRLYHSEEKLRELDEAIRATERDIVGQAQQAVDDAERATHEARKAQAKTFKDISKRERAIKLLERQIEDKQPEVVKLTEQIEHLRKKAKQLGTNLAQLEEDAQKQDDVIRGLDQEMAKVKDIEREFEREWQRKYQERRNLVLDEDNFVEYTRLKDEVYKATLDEQRRHEAAKRRVKVGTSELRQIKEKLEAAKQKLATISENKQALADQKRQTDDQLKAARDDIDAVNREIDMAKHEYDRLTQTEVELNEKLKSILAQLSQARADQHESERESRLSETVASLRRLFTGVHGRISDLCKPTQRQYDLAVATALGRHIDAIVVDTQAAAIECIAYMREKRSCQATFLPLDTLVADTSDAAARHRHLHAGARPITDVLQFNPAFEPAIRYACGQAVVCDSLDIAKDICYRQRQDVKAVTLDGTVIHRGGLITGGVGRMSGRGDRVKRWQAQELADLRGARDRLGAELHAIAQQKRRAGRDELLRAKLTGLEKRQQILRDNLTDTERKL
ncbi:Structural maintenance of chromosomes protein 1, partial [Spiromyces aspiralis]